MPKRPTKSTKRSRRRQRAPASASRARKKASLLEANRRLKTVQVASEIATWTWDIRKNKVVADKNMAALFGVSAKDAAGGPIERYLLAIHPDDREAVRASIAKAVKGPDDRYETNYRIVKQDGSIAWVTARGAVERGADGKARYFPGVAIDISRLKASEQKSDDLRFRLDQQSRILDITLSHISDFAYIFDRDGRFVFVNQALLDLWGLKLEDAVGKNFFDLKYPDELAARLQRQIQKVFDTKEGLTDQTEYTSQTGAGGYYEYIFRPVFDRTGEVELVAGSTRDITEHKRAELELREARMGLEKMVNERTVEVSLANESLRNLSARLLNIRDEESRRLARELHDSVGQMITAISMNIETVNAQTHKLDQRGADAVKENLVLIKEISKEIRTISYLLHPPLLDELGLQTAVRWYVDGFAERSNIDVELEMSESFRRLPSEVETAAFRIVQECLTNLHRHSGSERALIRVLDEQDQIVVVVQDWGKGIPAEALSRVNSHGLSGVGFRGMKERLRHLHGTLSLQSDSNGTIVTAAIPAGKTAAG